MKQNIYEKFKVLIKALKYEPISHILHNIKITLQKEKYYKIDTINKIQLSKVIAYIINEHTITLSGEITGNEYIDSIHIYYNNVQLKTFSKGDILPNITFTKTIDNSPKHISIKILYSEKSKTLIIPIIKSNNYSLLKWSDQLKLLKDRIPDVTILNNYTVQISKFEFRDKLYSDSEIDILNKAINIVIPFKDKLEYLQKCIDSIIENTEYSNYTITLVNNNSINEKTNTYLKSLSKNKKIKIKNFTEEFNFSKIYNETIKSINQEIIVLLNNDIEIKTKRWLYSLLSVKLNKNIGAVGARLIYPNKTIQHDGIAYGYDLDKMPYIKHVNKNENITGPNKFMKTNKIRYTSAVTAACLMIHKTDYILVNGFDQKNLSISFNDVDLCFKLLSKGKKNILHTDLNIIHHESVSRNKFSKTEPKEFKYIYKKWENYFVKGDEYYPTYLTIQEDQTTIKINN